MGSYFSKMLSCVYYFGEKGPMKDLCTKLVPLFDKRNIPWGSPETEPNQTDRWVTPGNVHLNLLLHFILALAGFIYGFHRRPRVSHAQFLYQKQYNEREQLIIDELWQVLEEKKDIREENQEQRTLCGNELGEYEKYDNEADRLKIKIKEMQDHVRRKSNQVQDKREKVMRLIGNMTNMGNVVHERPHLAETQRQILDQLAERIQEHNVI